MPEQKSLSINAGGVGSATLVAGTVSVALASVKATSIIFLSAQNVSGTAGTLSVSITAGVGFDINSTSGTDTRSITYLVTIPIPPPHVFSPLDIAGLKVWLSADVGAYVDAGVTLATNGQAVQQWNDQSPEGNNVDQATVGFRPLYVTGIVNGKPIIRFDGVDDYIEKTYGAALTQPNTVIIVVKLISATGFVFGGVAGCADRNDFGPGILGGGDLAVYAGTGFTDGTESVPTAFLLFSVVFDGASSELFKGGTSIATGDAGAQSAGGLRLGTACSVASFEEMDVAEILVYNASLSPTNRAQVEAYLQSKYGI